MDHATVMVEGNVMLPVDVRQGESGVIVTYATSRAEGDGNLGRVITRFDGETASVVVLTPAEGDYGPPVVAPASGALWVAHTAYAHKQRSILIHAIVDGKRAASVTMAGPGKIDNPHIVLHHGALHAVWEDYDSGDSRVAHLVLDPVSLAAVDAAEPVPVTAPKAYKPQLISDGSRLYLVCELYLGGRYRLMARCLMPDASIFSAPVEIGFEERNDQAASLAIHEGKLLVVWENSSPLDKGYAWTSPAGNTVVMPGFGHGWRVNTRMGLRRVYHDDEGWHLENLRSVSADPLLQAIDEQEAASAPRLQVAGDGLYVSYVRWDRGAPGAHRGWQIHTKRLDGHRWIPVGVSGLIQK